MVIIWKWFLCPEIKQSILKFSRDFTWFVDVKIVLKIITKMKGKINLPTKGTLKGKSKRHLYFYKTLWNSIEIWKKLNFLSEIPNLSHIHQLSILVIFSLIFALYFTSAKNNIQLLDPSPNKNFDVSIASNETTENIFAFMAFNKNSHLKWEEILKNDKLKCPKSFISNKKKQKSFVQK